VEIRQRASEDKRRVKAQEKREQGKIERGREKNNNVTCFSD
jgi:hypothetical protein